jgi:hypothetical protein
MILRWFQDVMGSESRIKMQDSRVEIRVESPATAVRDSRNCQVSRADRTP